ncbi:MAG: DUF1850 domain-containing protein [Spirochaetaceae bacterium]|nr:DUF1850 domain-containing protein [Spirochaetaceae bacterium]
MDQKGSRGFKARAAAVAFLASAALAALLCATGFEPARGPRLAVLDRKGRELAEIDLPGGRFSQRFLHSFHLTPVEEFFRIEADGGIRLYELRYESCGVGMPTEAEGGYRLEDGVFVLAMDRSFKNIPLFVSIVPGHGLAAEGNFRPFTDWAAPEELVILQGRTKPTLRIRR